MSKETNMIRQEFLTGERALFQTRNLEIYDAIFDDGESPLKESRDIRLYGSMFKWKYPLWYSHNIFAGNCTWFEMARAGVWYTDNIAVKDALIEAPKNFRRCRGVTLDHVDFHQCLGNIVALQQREDGSCNGKRRLLCHEQP